MFKNNNLVKSVKNKYQQNREEYGSMQIGNEIFVEPSVAHRGETIKVNYQGLLKNSGATTVFLHYGFDQWHTPETVRMDKNEDGSFRADIQARGDREINFCFKDSAENWDNNNGSNWSISVQ